MLDMQVQVETTENHNFWMEWHNTISKEKKIKAIVLNPALLDFLQRASFNELIQDYPC